MILTQHQTILRGLVATLASFLLATASLAGTSTTKPAPAPSSSSTQFTPRTAPKPAPAVPAQNAQFQMQGPNITRFGPRTTYGKVGERFFVEGRDLDPNNLVMQLTVGGRTARFQRQSGGNSGRVEFIIPADALTGEITASLQAVQGGTTVLASEFGVCDKISIESLSPSTVTFDERGGRNSADEYPLSGNRLTLSGACLDEVQFSSSKTRSAIFVGTGALTINKLVSRSYNEVVVELGSYVPPSAQFSDRSVRRDGPISLNNPKTGPRLVIEDVAAANAKLSAPTPTPTPPLTTISISRVESMQSWGPTGQQIQVPFVVTQTDPFTSTSRPKVWNPFIRVSGQNLQANPDTEWALGNMPLNPQSASGSNTEFSAHVGANAVTGPVCATRRDGKRSCQVGNLTVVGGLRITQVPAGWPRNGDFDQGHVYNLPVRQRQSITGFDLVPVGVNGLVAEMSVSNENVQAAQACNLDLRVLSMSPSRIDFSFGTPGGQRPANCSPEQEEQVELTRPAPPPQFGSAVIQQGRVVLTLYWTYNGVREVISSWNLHGTP